MTNASVAAPTHTARLIFTDLVDNHNKYWHADLTDCTLSIAWGRVGVENGQSQTLTFESPEKAEKAFVSKRGSKMRKGYTEQKTLLGTSPKAVEIRVQAAIDHSQDSETKKLIDFLVKRNVHKIEDTTSIRLENGHLATPLGPVTTEGLDEAEQILHRMGNSRGLHLTDLANRYLRIVPRNIGTRRVDPTDLFGSAGQLQSEQATLDSLRAVIRDLEQQATGQAPTFQTRLTLVGRDREALFQEIRALYKKSANANHTTAAMSLHRVWEMNIASADAAFEGPRLGNVKRLWHGTKDANLLSILKTGFVIPKQHGSSMTITGRMYGDGVYFSDQSTKSLNYATSFWGGKSSERCFMLLNDVAMGKEFMATSSFSGGCRKGYDSTFAKAGRSGVRNNEMIVYRTSQVKPVFLCEFR